MVNGMSKDQRTVDLFMTSTLTIRHLTYAMHAMLHASINFAIPLKSLPHELDENSYKHETPSLTDARDIPPCQSSVS